MKKPKRPPQTQARAAAARARAGSACRALIRVDGTAIRRKIRKDYERVRRNLDQAREALRQFEAEDLPAFRQWLSRKFGALLTELRELDHQSMNDSRLIARVQDEMFFSGCTPAEAYLRATGAWEEPKPPTPPPGTGRDDEPEFDFAGKSGRQSRRESDPDADFDPWSEPTGDSFFDELFDGLPGGPGRGSQRDGERQGGRLKELYRALARRLHPDAQTEMTREKLEWWHQAQAAYEAGNEDELEVILSLCEISEQGTTDRTSVSSLQRITGQLKEALRQLKYQITDRRQDPAWGFAAGGDRERVATRMRSALEFELANMRSQRRQAEATIARWKAAAEKFLKRKQRAARHKASDQ